MSKVVILKQGKALHVVTDGASYMADGRVSAIEQKTSVLPHLNTVIYSRGPARTSLLLGLQIQEEFTSFDAIIGGDISFFMRAFYHEHENHFRSSGFPDAEVYFFGWSQAKDRPEAHLMRCGFEDSDMFKDQADIGYRPEPFKLVEVKGKLALAPPVDLTEMMAAGFPSQRRPDEMEPSVDLLHLFEIQRRKLSSMKPWLDPIRTGAGFAEMTTIRRDEITQKILERYPEQVGDYIAPGPIAWAQWRAQRKANSRKWSWPFSGR